MLIAAWVFSCLVIVFIGIWSGRKVKTNAAWTGGDHSLSATDITFILVAWQIGGIAIVGDAQTGYTTGMSIGWHYLFSSLYLLVVGLMAKLIRNRIQVEAMSTFLGNRYGNLNRRWYTYVWIAYAFVGYLPFQLKTMASIVQIAIPGRDRIPAMAIGLILPLIYTYFSGIRGSASVGRLVSLGMYALLIGFILATLPKFGGYEGMITASSNPLAGSFTQMSVSRLWSWCIGAILGTTVTQAVLQPILAAKTPEAAKRGGIFSYLFVIPITFLTGMIGVMASASGTDLGDGSTAFAWTIKNYSNPIIAGVIFAFATMIIAATMQTILLGTATIVGDLYKTDFNKNATDAQKLRVSRISAVAIAALGLIFTAILPDSQIIVLSNAMAQTATTPISFSVFASLLWKKTTKQGSLWSMVLGLVTGLVWMFAGFDAKIPVLYPVFIVTYAVGILVSLATYKPQVIAGGVE